MSVQAQVDRVRRLWQVDEHQYDDTTAVEDFNIVYHDIENTIVTEVWEDFFYDILTVDTTVVGQSEYTLPEWLTGDYTSLYKNLWVSIKYGKKFEKATKIYPNLLPQDLQWYETNQSPANPVYHISDKSYFIYPAPTVEVSEWLKIYWIKNLADVTISTTELFAGSIPSKFYSIIALWMLEFVYTSQGKVNEAINARARYERERSKLVEYLSDRDDGIYEIQAPDLSYYK